MLFNTKFTISKMRFSQIFQLIFTPLYKNHHKKTNEKGFLSFLSLQNNRQRAYEKKKILQFEFSLPHQIVQQQKKDEIITKHL